MKLHIRYCLILFSLTVTCFSCTWTESSLYSEENGEDIPVVFDLNLPVYEGNNSTLRSIESADENKISTLEVLSFAKVMGYYKYAYRSQGKWISGYKYEANLKEKSDDQIFVILLNASSLVDEAGLSFGENYETALSKLIVTSDNEWPAKINGNSSFTPFPMYGRTYDISTFSESNPYITVDIVRMLSRIDVRLDPEKRINKFRLKKVMLYNRKTCGYLPYNDNDWNDTHVIRAYVPSVHPDGAALTIKNPSVTYEVTSGSELLASLYTFEAKGVQDKNEATAIVVGGYYDPAGNPDESDGLSYYRIDINTKEMPVGYVSQDIMRNYLYDIKIQAVEHKGYDTPDEAFNGDLLIANRITPWNLATNKVVLDKQHSLIVSHPIITFNKDNNNTIYFSARTDHPGGVYADLNGKPDWLSIGGTGGGTPQIDLNISVVGNKGGTRSFSFIVSADNMKYLVKITQEGVT